MIQPSIPNPGQSKSKFISRELIKTILPPQSSPGMSVGQGRQTLDPDCVMGIIPETSTLTEIEPYRPAMLGFGPVITPGADNLHLASHPVYCMAHNDAYYTSLANLFPIWGVSQEYITRTKPGKIKVSGPTWFNTAGLEIIDNGGNSYDVFNRKLWKTYGGRLEILSQNAPWTLVNLRSCNVVYLGRSSISGVSLTTGGTITLYERTGSSYTPTSLTTGAIAWPSAIVGQQFVELACRGHNIIAMELC